MRKKTNDRTDKTHKKWTWRTKMTAVAAGVLSAGLLITGCASTGAYNADVKDATSFTKKTNNAVYDQLNFKDEQEKAFATRGLIDAPKELEIKDKNGKVVWSQKAYDFLDTSKKAPDTVNPSLWRNTQLNHIYGLFKVSNGIYQVRGYDMSNITFIKSDTGWIVFDSLMTTECAQAAMQLVTKNLGKRPVKAVIYSHSHVDHFGGVRGVVSPEYVKKNNIPIIAPQGFLESATSENVYAGTAMGRRASYQYGTMLKPGAKGSLSIGIGMGQSKGVMSFIPPNKEITKTGETLTVDGVKMEFQLTPGTEAPAEMNTWFPQKKALWMAENCTGTLHNLYTLRGAQVRDGNAWAEYLMETLERYGDQANVVFQAHNWPHFGNNTIKAYITNTAACYKFINDQTLNYIKEGLTMNEIANKIKLPDELQKVWYTRQYYGTVSHNSKAVYQKYMGWYDGNPVHLAELEPEESAKKFVEYMGDPDKVLEKAKEDYDKGEYQWVAQVTNILVYNDPKNKNARYLCADALEQLGYQAESGPWRNEYLTAAKELREGVNRSLDNRATNDGKLNAQMSNTMILDYLGICIDSNKAQHLSFTANLNLTDSGEKYVLVVKNGVLLYEKDAQRKNPDVTWTTTKRGLAAMMPQVKNGKAARAKLIKQTGDTTLLEKFCSYMSSYDWFFNIVEP